jgi:cytochrome c peroxidase
MSIERSLVPLVLLLAGSAVAQLPPVPAPRENPITPAKAVLGKILFWDEQLSADETMSCGTCHMPDRGGTDPRLARHPGLDRLWQTPDDKLASPGVLRSDAQRRFRHDAIFAFATQVTRRSAQSNLGAAYAPEAFWDGRAGRVMRDPLTNQIAIADGGALENQALGPILDAAEMGHDGRTWAEVTTKLAAARPLALATNLPPDVAAALQSAATYPDLFRVAFGDAAITPVRIAFAIATYQRTLIPDRTPWDAFIAGNTNALTMSQRAGWMMFQQSGCVACHQPPLFTDHTFRNIGLRPIAEDAGRQEVTQNPADRGRFKVPTLRNVGLKSSHMHHGQLENLSWVFEHYEGHTQWFLDNIDPAFLALRIPPFARASMAEFLAIGLTDPRVASRQPPFDRPTLRSERGPNRAHGDQTTGSGGFAPLLLATAPAFAGSLDFRLGIGAARANAPALLLLSAQSYEPPVYAGPIPFNVDPFLAWSLPLGTNGTLDGTGAATLLLAIPADPALRGGRVHAQGFVADGAAPGGFAATRGTELRID